MPTPGFEHPALLPGVLDTTGSRRRRSSTGSTSTRSTQVLQSDPTTSSPTVETDYTYTGAGLALRRRQRHRQGQVQDLVAVWRGYATVTHHHRRPRRTHPEPQSLYYQGMDGDKLAAGGTKTVRSPTRKAPRSPTPHHWPGKPARRSPTTASAGRGLGTIYDKFIYQTATQSQSWGTVVADIVARRRHTLPAPTCPPAASAPRRSAPPTTPSRPHRRPGYR